ncbi:MAG: class I SAM-dependent methyltransferase [Thermoplasmatales archaeon]|nr:class I SAM-dependent methyltransferase [Thermoplasmatales archaeon]
MYLKENKKNVWKIYRKSFVSYWKNYIMGQDALTIPYKNYELKKLPCDTFIYPDLLHRFKPDCIIEIGTDSGGSAVFLSDQFDGKLVTIDINKPKQETLNDFKKRDIVFVHSDATLKKTMEEAKSHCFGNTFIIDDGSHRTTHVYESFKLFSPLVKPGGFYIIEDGMSGALLNCWRLNPMHMYKKFYQDRNTFQPNYAIDKILKEYPDFTLFEEYDKYMFSTTYRGILRKKEDK